MSLPLFQVDAFTAEAFAGNPAAVCLLDGPREDGWLQAVAREMNLSETAFLTPMEGGFGLRWLTPRIEVSLCGHATLASAHILWEEGLVRSEEGITFHTRSGVLKAARLGEEIELDFPLEPEEVAIPPDGLAEALGTDWRYAGKNRLDYLIEVESEEVLRGLRPDFRRLSSLVARGLIVTSRGFGAPYDFVSRFFAPAAGIDEDPVTGSAHCCLGAYWQKQLGKSELLGYQASERGGVVRVRVAGERAFLGGKAVTIFQGKLCV